MVAQSNLVAYYMALRGIVSTSNKSPRPTQQQKEEVQEKKFEQKKEEEFSLFEMSAEEEAKHEEELQRRADENVAKKKASGKVAEVLKSAVIIDVKPWEDTTDMMKMEELVRGLQVDGLEWKACKWIIPFKEYSLYFVHSQIGCNRLWYQEIANFVPHC